MFLGADVVVSLDLLSRGVVCVAYSAAGSHDLVVYTPLSPCPSRVDDRCIGIRGVGASGSLLCSHLKSCEAWFTLLLASWGSRLVTQHSLTHLSPDDVAPQASCQSRVDSSGASVALGYRIWLIQRSLCPVQGSWSLFPLQVFGDLPVLCRSLVVGPPDHVLRRQLVRAGFGTSSASISLGYRV